MIFLAIASSLQGLSHFNPSIPMSIHRGKPKAPRVGEFAHTHRGLAGRVQGQALGIYTEDNTLFPRIKLN